MTHPNKPDEAVIQVIQQAICTWGKQVHRTFPWRETDNPFHILLAEILLQQTFARKVVPVYKKLISQYPTPKHLADADPQEVRQIIYSLGLLYRAETLIDIARKLVDEFRGEVPKKKASLLKLRGVGQYVSNAVLCFAFGMPLAIIDTNVLRIYRRIFGVMKHSTQAKPDIETVAIARAMIPEKRIREFNWALLDFAALVCTHHNPTCPKCPLLQLCIYGKQQVEN